MNWVDHVGKLVVGFSGADPQRAVWHIGPMVGYMVEPTLFIGTEDGRNVSWAQSLCRLATHEEEVAYWRDRAEAAEVKLKGLMP